MFLHQSIGVGKVNSGPAKVQGKASNINVEFGIGVAELANSQQGYQSPLPPRSFAGFDFLHASVWYICSAP